MHGLSYQCYKPNCWSPIYLYSSINTYLYSIIYIIFIYTYSRLRNRWLPQSYPSVVVHILTEVPTINYIFVTLTCLIDILMFIARWYIINYLQIIIRYNNNNTYTTILHYNISYTISYWETAHICNLITPRSYYVATLPVSNSPRFFAILGILL